MMSHPLVTADQFQQLFVQNTLFLDVRSEHEFAKGSFPNSINRPILNDSEHHQIGVCYKLEGKQAAIRLGHQLVSGETKQNRISGWRNIAIQNTGTHIFCWRGGMRSALAHQWLNETGISLPVIEGGYRALRRYLMQVIDNTSHNFSIIRIGGKTGTAKTLLINAINSGVDLEKYALHRGSSFGHTVQPQPTQSDFEHALAIDLLRKTHIPFDQATLFVEDESRTIGTVAIPENFFQAMRRSPIILIEMPLEFRIQRILQEYIIDTLAAFQAKYFEHGFEYFSAYLHNSLLRIQKRLGLERYSVLHNLLANALKIQSDTGSIQRHESWITLLLAQYYDPMYTYQINKNKELVIFSGNYQEVLGWIMHDRKPYEPSE